MLILAYSFIYGSESKLAKFVFLSNCLTSQPLFFLITKPIHTLENYLELDPVNLNLFLSYSNLRNFSIKLSRLCLSISVFAAVRQNLLYRHYKADSSWCKPHFFNTYSDFCSSCLFQKLKVYKFVCKELFENEIVPWDFEKKKSCSEKFVSVQKSFTNTCHLHSGHWDIEWSIRNAKKKTTQNQGEKLIINCQTVIDQQTIQ